MDARRITRIEKGNPDSWAEVKERLPKLRLPSFYRYTYYGFARGDEAKNYVENIRRYYQTIIGYESQTQKITKDNYPDSDFQIIKANETQAISNAVANNEESETSLPN